MFGKKYNRKKLLYSVCYENLIKAEDFNLLTIDDTINVMENIQKAMWDDKTALVAICRTIYPTDNVYWKQYIDFWVKRIKYFVLPWGCGYEVRGSAPDFRGGKWFKVYDAPAIINSEEEAALFENYADAEASVRRTLLFETSKAVGNFCRSAASKNIALEHKVSDLADSLEETDKLLLKLSERIDSLEQKI